MIKPAKPVSFVFCVCVTLLSFSCNSKLTQSRASDIIRESYGFPLSRTELFQHGDLQYSRHFGGSNLSEMKYLAEQGFITFEYKGVKKDDFFMYDTYHLAVTPEGREYIVDETSTPDGRRFYGMKAADVNFDEVTEMIASPDSAKVDFTWRYTDITPFGIAANLRMREYADMCGIVYSGDEYEEGKSFSESVVFINDDGWRIQPPLVLRGGLIEVRQE